MTHVAIVGGGIAGLAAAQALTSRAVAVTVFDRGEGPGGRCGTRHVGVGTFDHGAQFFTARDERFKSAVASLIERGAVDQWQGRLVELDAVEISPLSQITRYVGVPTMQHLAFSLAHGLDFVGDTRVTRARLSGRGWRLFDDNGSELGEYDALILALPPEQAQGLMPPGTPLRLELMKARSQACWALMLGFEQRLPLEFDAAFVTGSELSWLARDSSKPGRQPGERWVAHASADWSGARLGHDRSEVAADMLTAFAAAVGLEELKPAHIEVHRWSLARAPRVAPVGELWDEDMRLALCGDWCISPRLEDAYLSGLDAATTLITGLLRHTGTALV